MADEKILPRDLVENPEPPTQSLAILDDGTNVFATSIEDIGNRIGVVRSVQAGLGISVDNTDPLNPVVTATEGGGDMFSAIYDPQGISNDAFARENHTGEQPISATTGLQDELDAISSQFTSTRTAIKAIDTNTTTNVYLTEIGREGQFVWREGDFSAEVAADTEETDYIEADGIGASEGAWVRIDAGVLASIKNGYRKSRNRITREIDIYDYCEDDPSSVVGEVNDAWDRAITDLNLLGLGVTLRIPAGSFQLDRSLVVPRSDAKFFEIVCEGGWSTRFYANAGSYTNNAMLTQDTAAQQLVHFKLRGGFFAGNSVAGYGYRFDYCNHGDFDGQEIIGTTAWAARLNGYCNTINTPKFHENVGGGLDISGVDVIDGIGNSNTNINGGIIYGNGGIGAKIANGWGISLKGTGIEGNAVAGLISHNVDGLYVGSGAYFERNGYVGLTLAGSLGSVTPHADIFLLAGDVELGYPGSGSGVRGAIIESCSFTPYGAYNVTKPGYEAVEQHCFVFATSLDNLRFSNNRMREPERVERGVMSYNYNFEAQCRSLVIEQNDRNDIGFLGAGSSSFTFNTAHNISDRFSNPENYASQVVSGYSIISGTTGAVADTGLKYGRHTIWQVTPGDKLYGVTLDLDLKAELRGKRVWFGFMYRVLDAGVAVQMGMNGHTNQDGTVTEGATPFGEWRTASVVREIGGDDDLTYSFKIFGGGSYGILMTCPVVAVVGNDLVSAMRAT